MRGPSPLRFPFDSCAFCEMRFYEQNSHHAHHYGWLRSAPGNRRQRHRRRQHARLDQFFQEYAHTELSASGWMSACLPGRMGNSEVGHTNIGAGRVVFQDLPRISKSIEDGDFFENPAYLDAMRACGKTAPPCT